MTTFSLEALGISQDDLIERVVNAAVTQLMTSTEIDDDDEEVVVRSPLARKMRDALAKRVDAKVEELADKYLTPLIATKLEGLVLQKTNGWGERTGEPMQFIEYLVHRAEAYMTEPVDSQGRSKKESGYSSNKDFSPRLTYLMDRHLQYRIDAAVSKVVQEANSHFETGINGAVKMALEKIKVSIKTNIN